MRKIENDLPLFPHLREPEEPKLPVLQPPEPEEIPEPEPPKRQSCLSAERLNQKHTQEEQAHFEVCSWCAYLSKHGDKECWTAHRLLEIGFGMKLTKAEQRHVKSCPICQWEQQELAAPVKPKRYKPVALPPRD